jgi:hypothetical protein
LSKDVQSRGQSYRINHLRNDELVWLQLESQKTKRNKEMGGKPKKKCKGKAINTKDNNDF